MDAEEVDKVTEARNFVDGLIVSIGTEHLQEVDANVLLVNTRARLFELRDIIQEVQEAQLHQQHPQVPPQPQDLPQGVGMNLANDNAWLPLLQNFSAYRLNPISHEAHLKSFLLHLEQRVGDTALFRVSFGDVFQQGPHHRPVFYKSVSVQHNNGEFSGNGRGTTVKQAERAAIFHLFQRAENEPMYHVYNNIFEERSFGTENGEMDEWE